MVNADIVKLLWEGAQCWEESLKLLRVAEEASVSRNHNIGESTEDMKAFAAVRRFFSLLSFLKLDTLSLTPTLSLSL